MIDSVLEKGKEDAEVKSCTGKLNVCTLSSPRPSPLTTAFEPRRDNLIRYCKDDWGCEYRKA